MFKFEASNFSESGNLETQAVKIFAGKKKGCCWLMRVVGSLMARAHTRHEPKEASKGESNEGSSYPRSSSGKEPDQDAVCYSEWVSNNE